ANALDALFLAEVGATDDLELDAVARVRRVLGRALFFLRRLFSFFRADLGAAVGHQVDVGVERVEPVALEAAALGREVGRLHCVVVAGVVLARTAVLAPRGGVPVQLARHLSRRGHPLGRAGHRRLGGPRRVRLDVALFVALVARRAAVHLRRILATLLA